MPCWFVQFEMNATIDPSGDHAGCEVCPDGSGVPVVATGWPVIGLITESAALGKELDAEEAVVASVSASTTT